MGTYQYKRGDRPLEGYTIQRAAGRGGFGEVYYAISDSGRQVALKAVQSYEQIELRGISQCMNLKSPHLVTIFDVKYNDQGRPFVIMEYVSGPALSDVLKESPGGLGSQKAAFFLREIGKGLSYLHECGIVHRDLKPSNIFYENGYVKIGDYGLTKAISAGHDINHTAAVGSVHYMAPEIGAGRYDRSVDIYALGILLYEMLTGQVPFLGSSPAEILMKHMTAAPDLTSIEEPFARVIRRALAKDPAERYQTVQEMVEDVFGSEHVRNSVSQFAPDELSVVAEHIAQKIQNHQAEIASCQIGSGTTHEEACLPYPLPNSPVLTEKDVTDVINSWSKRTRFLGAFKYLSPLLAYCDLTGVDQILLLRWTLRALREDRKLAYDRKPYPSRSPIDITPFNGDAWAVRLEAPESFLEQTQDWVSPQPNGVEKCTECSGTGHVPCDKCNGTGNTVTPCGNCDGKGRIVQRREIVCPACNGNPIEHKRRDSYGNWVGGCGACNDKGVVVEGYRLCLVCQGDPYNHKRKDRFGNWVPGCGACNDRGTVGKPVVQWKKCSECAGTGHRKHRCEGCEGKGTQRCASCGGSGKLVTYARVTARFEAREKCLEFPDLHVSAHLHASEWRRTWSGAAIEAVPVTLLQLRPDMKHDLELAVQGLETGESSRMVRFEVSLFVSPIVTCRLRYRTRDFVVMIHASSQRILTLDWAPKNWRHAVGLCLGLPVAAVALAGLFVWHSIGFILASIAGLLLSAPFTIWAVFSEPKARRGSPSSPS